MSQSYPPDNGNQPLNYQQQQYQQPVPPQYQQQSMPLQAPQYPPVGQPAPYPQQQQYAQYPSNGQSAPPMMAPPMMQTNVNVNVQQSGPGFLVRAIYFWFIGWWFGLFWLNLGFFLCALIITLPIGLMMLNRIPQVMTLKPAGTKTNVNVSTIAVQSPYGGPAIMQQNINVTVGGTQQYNFFIRALYFIFFGWWAGYIWANLAYLCCVVIVLLPVGVIMFNQLPMVLTLHKN
jgi:uncharacterized membrane protein YccF (DUF307 family)